MLNELIVAPNPLATVVGTPIKKSVVFFPLVGHYIRLTKVAPLIVGSGTLVRVDIMYLADSLWLYIDIMIH